MPNYRLMLQRRPRLDRPSSLRALNTSLICPLNTAELNTPQIPLPRPIPGRCPPVLLICTTAALCSPECPRIENTGSPVSENTPYRKFAEQAITPVQHG